MHKDDNIKVIKRDISTESKKEYLFNHLFFGGAFSYILLKLLPVIAPVARYEQSVLRLVICMIVTSSIGLLITYSKRRTWSGWTIDICAGLGVYVVITLGLYKLVFFKYILCGFVIALFVSRIIVLFCKAKLRKRTEHTHSGRICNKHLAFNRNISAVFGIALIVLPCFVAFTSNDEITNYYVEQNGSLPIYEEDDYEINPVYDDEYSLVNNIDTIRLIRSDDTWSKLDYQERCTVIIDTTYCEARYLGIPFEIEIAFSEDMDDYVLGNYSHSKHRVSYNANKIMHNDAEKTLFCILHEMRHVYQGALIDIYSNLAPEKRNLLCFSGIDEWVKNCNNYIVVDSEGDRLQYSTQPLEVDSDEYAAANLLVYYKQIDKLIQSGKSEGSD